MFNRIIGEYLVKRNYLTKEQLDEIIHDQASSRVKLGLIAVSEKMLDLEQADKINMLQSVNDKRFGDIAVEHGYLTNEQVSELLRLQGSSYHRFIQTIVDKKYLKIDEVENIVNEYKTENNYSDEDIEALKSDDIDRITGVFVHTGNELCDEYIGLMIRNINRFISTDICISSPYETSAYKADTLGVQNLTGDHNILIAIGANDSDILVVANRYAKEQFEGVGEDAYDSVCEFINCVNGLFASKLSTKDINIDMLPPLSYNRASVVAAESLYVEPLIIDGKRIDIIIGFDSSMAVN